MFKVFTLVRDGLTRQLRGPEMVLLSDPATGSALPNVPSWLDADPNLPRWRFFGNQASNLSTEIYSMQMHLCRLALQVTAESEKIILRDCYRLLKLCAKAMRNPFRSNLFKYQMLQTISQEIILVDSVDSLRSNWTTIQKRVSGLERSESEVVEGLKSFGIAKAYFEKNPSSDADMPTPAVRYALHDVKKYLDEKIALQIWKSSAMKLRSNLHMSLTAILSILVAFHLIDIPNIRYDEPLWMMMTGALGAAISSIARPSPAEIPLSATSGLLRPVLGAVAGLLFYLVAQSGGLQPTNPFILYLFALAFGFSDEVLVKLLDDAGRRAGSEATKALGHVGRGRS